VGGCAECKKSRALEVVISDIPSAYGFTLLVVKEPDRETLPIGGVIPVAVFVRGRGCEEDEGNVPVVGRGPRGKLIAPLRELPESEC
jgi:hypothetical protein